MREITDGAALARGTRMVQLVARSVKGTLLFLRWSEARHLWDLLADALGSANSLMLMPDHVHAIVKDKPAPFGRALAAYARWRNAARGENGPVWRRTPAPQAFQDAAHARRAVRYQALNPCRKGIVADPLAWTFSTHRECVGLTLTPIRSRVSDAVAHHAYVSGDPSVDVAGTELPVRRASTPGERELEAVTSELLRVPLADLRNERDARRLLIQLARDWAGWGPGRAAEFCGVDPSTVWRAPQLGRDAERLAATVVGDPRFPGLDDGDLRRLPGWGVYRSRR